MGWLKLVTESKSGSILGQRGIKTSSAICVRSICVLNKALCCLHGSVRVKVMNTEHIRLELLEKQHELLSRIDAIGADFRRGRDQDFAEQATECENDEVLISLKSEAKQELQQIASALHRLDTGRYGVCQDCGKDIENKRLDVLPYSTLCRTCAEE